MYKSYAAVVWQTGRLCGWPMYPGIYFRICLARAVWLPNKSIGQSVYQALWNCLFYEQK